MKASELRIGNWIQEESTKIIHQANIYSISCCLDSSDQKDRYIAIPITEEWLLKFGYTFHSSYNEVAIKKEYWHIIGKQFGSLELWFYEGRTQVKFNAGQYNFTTIEFVHQLQNLYFALTGKELTLKP